MADISVRSLRDLLRGTELCTVSVLTAGNTDNGAVFP